MSKVDLTVPVGLCTFWRPLGRICLLIFSGPWPPPPSSKPATTGRVLLMLLRCDPHSPALHPRTVKDPYDYLGSTWIIQDKLLILRSANEQLSIVILSLHVNNISRLHELGPGYLGWRRWASLCLVAVVQSLSCVWLWGHMDCRTPGFLVLTVSRSLPKFMSIALVMSSNILSCHPLLLLPSIFPSIRDFSSESVLHIRWSKYWSFIFSISPSNGGGGLIQGWFPLRLFWSCSPRDNS